MIGQKLGSFRIEAELGSGAMGVVYRGINEAKNKPAAIKVISVEQMGKGKAFERFVREAEILEQFRHPNIVRYMARGRSGGQVLLCDGVHHGPDARQGAPGTWNSPLARGRRPGHPALRGLALLPRARGRPPRPQAVQPDGHRDRPAQADRLRHRQGPRRDRPDRHRADPGHGHLHGPRADPRHARDQPQDRPLRARGGLLPDADRRPAVLRRHGPRDDACSHQRTCEAAERQGGGDPQGPRRPGRRPDGEAAAGSPLGRPGRRPDPPRPPGQDVPAGNDQDGLAGAGLARLHADPGRDARFRGPEEEEGVEKEGGREDHQGTPRNRRPGRRPGPRRRP